MFDRRKTAGLTSSGKRRWADWVRAETLVLALGAWEQVQAGDGVGGAGGGRVAVGPPLFTEDGGMGGVECTQQESWEEVLSGHFKEQESSLNLRTGGCVGGFCRAEWPRVLGGSLERA